MVRLRCNLALFACVVHSTTAGPLKQRYANTTLPQKRITPAAVSSVTFVFVGGSSSAIVPIAAETPTVAEARPENAAIANQETSRPIAESNEISASATRSRTSETPSTTSIHFSYSPPQWLSNSTSDTSPCTHEFASIPLVTSMVTLYTTVYPSFEPTIVGSEAASSGTAQVQEVLDQTSTATVTLYTTLFTLQGSTSTTERSHAGEGSATGIASVSTLSGGVSSILHGGNLGQISSLLFTYSPQLATTTPTVSSFATEVAFDATVTFSYAPPGSLSSITSKEPAPTGVTTESAMSYSALPSDTSTQVTGHPPAITTGASTSILRTSKKISTPSQHSSRPVGITIVPVNPEASILTVTKTQEGTKTVTEILTVRAKL